MVAKRLRAFWEHLVAHPWLVGDPGLPGRVIGRRARWITIGGIVLANTIGALVVIAFALLALPKPDGEADGGVLALNLGLAGVYVLLALVVGVVWGRRAVEAGPHGTGGWLAADRAADAAERTHVLRAPLRIMKVQAALWGGATVCFAVLDGIVHPLLGLGVGLTVALGGLTTSAFGYLLGELALRPIVARALDHAAPDRRGVPGVATRWLLAWTLGTAVPVVGLVMIGIVAFTNVDITITSLAISIVVLGPIALLFGVFVTLLAVYATVHPIGAIRRALARVEEGDYDVELQVWDSSEIGELQGGFNAMASGLRERERMRDLFGRQVGADVARQALAHDVRLGGEVRDVTVLFVDLVGSTALAARLAPEQVVALLNRFFADVVDVVEGCGGWINKFQGDAALAIFGAPAPLDGAQARALRAARELHERLRAHAGELDFGIGVAGGDAVAGHVGAERRFEYTVIGDPVNEAARLSDLAKQKPGRVLASASTVARAGDAERAQWALGEQVTLRGRATPTQLASPAS
ncbi:adenylate/guanylate cyclase domain-containing protein [Conexibacter woesei]|uniref:Adenylate/guanylate cyclase with integral membrane sensor n=1 Tax=Conexibacter woesei (strain DSM 14684 / CCUG 47730 / CIP 108061 / JCM 11494 / NBRC 100937 / ID131577) TaxID=469383 RepID=D3F5Q0_CONWI|nr:adenylate/guanylate cyclase domain-containing protein [Conexibacter woesei]ADB52599.1 adenylate/guanylate cyclase with integral membrane sensor [Conexibacter woesei DSM 14684]